MSQLARLKELVNPSESDSVLTFYLDRASDIICELRDSVTVETSYLTVQISIAIDLYNKRGAEGELAHSENGMARSYSSTDVSADIIACITPYVKTPWSTKRVVT